MEKYAAKRGGAVVKYEMVFNDKVMDVFFVDHADGTTELFDDKDSRTVKQIIMDYPNLNMMYDPVVENLIWLSATPHANDSLIKVLWTKYGLALIGGQTQAKASANPYYVATAVAREHVFAGRYLSCKGEGYVANLSINWQYYEWNVGRTESDAFVGGFWNDVMSSITVASASWIRVHEHANFSGGNTTFTAGTDSRSYDLTKERMSIFWKWNDRISSISWGGN